VIILTPTTSSIGITYLLVLNYNKKRYNFFKL
jgi:hypothetical protein